MKGAGQGHPRAASMERRWILPLAAGSVISLFLLFFSTLSVSSPATFPSFRPFSSLIPQSLVPSFSPVFVEAKLRAAVSVSSSTSPPPPRLAYLISGSAGDGDALKRTLLALYHPRNRYVLHLDLEAPTRERLDLRDYVDRHPVFMAVGNVWMITKANLITYRGPTMVTNTLHAAAVLLRNGGEWDWFINLSASDYPLVTQDDLLHTLSYLPRDLNFMDHTSNIGWKEFQRAKPIIIDPGLYMGKKEELFWISQRRSVPTAFKLFTGHHHTACGEFGKKIKPQKGKGKNGVMQSLASSLLRLLLTVLELESCRGGMAAMFRTDAVIDSLFTDMHFYASAFPCLRHLLVRWLSLFALLQGRKEDEDRRS